MSTKTISKTKKRTNMGMSENTFDIIIVSLLILVMMIVLYPVIFVVSASFSSATALTTGKVFLWPVEFTLKGYEMVMNNKLVWIGFGNSVFYVACGVVQHMLYNVLAAYVLSRRDCKIAGWLMLFFMIPQWFSGGIIPKYIQYSAFGMVNNRLGYVLQAGFMVSFVVIMRTYFQSSIPGELLEAAKVDGISDAGYLTKVVLPLSKPVLAVISLYYMVGDWNDYMGPMIFLRKTELQTLQLILRQILNASRVDASQMMNSALAQEMAKMTEVMKYSLIVVATVPLLVVYPFIRKFFEKGVMMGSLKG